MTQESKRARQRWDYLTELLDWVDHRGIASLDTDAVKDLCRLYRQVTIDLSRARTSRADPERIAYLNRLAARAHSQIYVPEKVALRPLLTYLITGFPRSVRRNARPIGVAAAVFVLSSVVSFLAVVIDPETAYSLFDPKVVEFENIRLESTRGESKGEYRGNFTFDVGTSPVAAVMIIVNNVKVAAAAFALGALCCLPGLLLLTFNGRMLGTLTGLVWNYSFFVDFYSLIMTHGVLELTAIVISGGAGLMLGWALIAPGELSRREALRNVGGPSLGLLGGACMMLVVAGLIEAFITPHAPMSVRWTVAGISALFLVVYFGWVGEDRSTVNDR